MNGLRRRLIWVCLLVAGCSNPFSSSDDLHFIGVWGPQARQAGSGGKDLSVQIGFLKQGRYLENNVQVGTYYVSEKRTVRLTDGANEIEYVMQITYNDGAKILVVVRVYSDTLHEIQVFNPETRGPTGKYDRLHSGDV